MRLDTPRGFSDILPEEALLREELQGRVRAVLAEAGYLPVEPPLLESREVLARAGRLKGVPFQLFDTDDHLLMLRPEFTLPIARLVATHEALGQMPLRLRYTGPVVREQAPGTGEARQFTQMGVELVGGEDGAAEAEVMSLLAACLEALDVGPWRLVLGSVAPMEALLAAAGVEGPLADRLRAALHESDLVALGEAAAASGLSETLCATIGAVASLRGGLEALDVLDTLLMGAGVAETRAVTAELRAIVGALSPTALSHLSLDFSLAGSFDYYTGAIFKAYAPRLSGSLAAGGRYDAVLAQLSGEPLSACGFALSLERVQEALQREGARELAGGVPAEPLRIAVPKGALAEGTRELLAGLGFDTSELADPGRKLLVEAGDAAYVIVRAMDAPIFVGHGGADCGICGADSLAEAAGDLVTLADLGFGGCRFVVAAPEATADAVRAAMAGQGHLVVATKYPRITRRYFESKGLSAEVITLRGNIELGPIVGMADCILDITATGATLAENHLEIVADDVMASTARFFASPVAYRTDARVAAMADAISRLGA